MYLYTYDLPIMSAKSFVDRITLMTQQRSQSSVAYICNIIDIYKPATRRLMLPRKKNMKSEKLISDRGSTI